MPKPLSEIIRAKLYTDPDYFGADVSTTRENNPKTKSINMSQIKSTFEPKEKTAVGTGSEKSRKNVSGMIDSIRKGKGDSIPPISVRRNPDGVGYQVLDGHHRFQAHQEAGAKQIAVREVPPAFIKKVEPSVSALPKTSTLDTVKSVARDYASKAGDYASKAMSNPVVKTGLRVLSNPVVGGITTAMEPTPANAGEDEFARQKKYQSKTP